MNCVRDTYGLLAPFIFSDNAATGKLKGTDMSVQLPTARVLLMTISENAKNEI